METGIVLLGCQWGGMEWLYMSGLYIIKLYTEISDHYRGGLIWL